MTAVAARGLSKKYKNNLAVDNIDISVPAGCCCGFLGKNGAGKTTTLKMLVGLKKPTAGEIAIMGAPQVFGQKNRLAFGYLPDVPTFYGYMTGAEFLDFCVKLCGAAHTTAERAARVKALLARVGLGKARLPIATYSRGMKQRLGIAQALVNDPQVIFMDEPISALDPIGRRDVTEIIRDLKSGGESTVFFSTHILADVEHVCDYVLIIEKGKIMAQDYIANLKAQHKRDCAELKFYNAETASKFKKTVSCGTGITIEETGTVSCHVRLAGGNGDDAAQVLSRRVTALLHEHELPVESYTAHSPTLEEIFYAVINK